MPPSPGRPRRASQELLQEAAFELFQLRGYRGTSVEQIAKTAGFSRATFFNFFSSKAELFWVETDALIGALEGFLSDRLEAGDPPELHDALLEYAETLDSTVIPWALQHYRLLEAADDLLASGAGRVMALNRVFLRYLERSEGGREPLDSVLLGARAAGTTSAVMVCLLAWIDAGVERGRLSEYLARGLRAGHYA